VVLLAVIPLLGLSGCIGQTSTLTARSDDPVIFTGAKTPRLLGSAPGDIVAFSYNPTDQWVQIPVQVDERKVNNFGTVYHGNANSVNILGYADPNTYAGADPNPLLDADDEIVFMARDAGGRPPAYSVPAGVVASTATEIVAVETLTLTETGSVYLFRRSGSLDPAAGKDYVSYQFSLNSGSYKTTYKFQDGPNPENSTVTTPYYQHHFLDRWASDSIKITTPGASGVDILDRHKNLFAPGNCGRSEDTFDDAEGAFIVNKDGPVRAIRSYIGANSGPNTQRTHFFYDRREDVVTDLRVHAIPGIMDFFDYSPAASGMNYSTDTNPTGVTIDGVPDTVPATAPGWEKVDGPQGSLISVGSYKTSFAPPTTASYYLDDSTPTAGAEFQCTGDAFAYGSSGARITSTLPDTDPGNGSTATLQGTRTMYFGSPGRTAADATLAGKHALNPVGSAVNSWDPPAP
jgi:hypothetical protein